MNFKLTPLFMLSVIALAAAVPMIFGVSPEALTLSAAVVAGSTLLLDRVPSSKRSAFGQLGEVGEVGEVDVEAQYKQVQSDLKKVGDELRTYAERSEKEIKNFSTMTEETRANVDKLLTTQGELQARLKAAEQQIVDMDAGGGSSKPKSLGQSVVASDQYANAGANFKGSFSVDVSASITSDTGSGGDLIQPQRVPGIVATPEQRLFLRDLLNWAPTQSNSIEYVRETGFTNSADVVSENPSAGKPESGLTFEADSAKVATIAHYIHASRQVLADAGMLQGHVDGRLRYGLKLKEEAQLLKGSGVGLNINGIFTQATAYSNPGVEIQNETMLDRLRVAMLQVTLAEYDADGIVLNPIDWTSIELTKTSDNAYLFATPRGLLAPGLWGRPVVASRSMDAGDFLTGSFTQGAEGWDREQVTVQISTEDRDNFIKNMVTILCEERVGLTVYRPESFVKGDFDGLSATSGA